MRYYSLIDVEWSREKKVNWESNSLLDTITCYAGLAVQKSAVGFLVDALNYEQGGKLLKVQKIGDIDIEVVSHSTLNVKERLILCRKKLLNSTDEEIMTELTG